MELECSFQNSGKIGVAVKSASLGIALRTARKFDGRGRF